MDNASTTWSERRGSKLALPAAVAMTALGAGLLIGGAGRANLFLSVLATAIVGVAFQPVLGGARRFVNRLVYGRRATPWTSPMAR